MGAVYDVEMFLDCKDKTGVVRLAQEFAGSARKWAVIDQFDDFSGMLRAFFTGRVSDDGGGFYSSGFDASYGWESVMTDFFESIVSELRDGSWLKVWPDHGMDFLKVTGGKIERNDIDEDEEEDETQ